MCSLLLPLTRTDPSEAWGDSIFDDFHDFLQPEWQPAAPFLPLAATTYRWGEIDEKQIDLALGYCNNSEYCPPEWVPRFEEMQNPDRLKSAVDSMQGYSAAAAAYDRD